MAKPSLAKNLQFEKQNKDMIKLPKHARVQKRPIPHAPVASPYAGPSVPKIVYVSTKSPFMSAVKRVQKLLRQAEKRATASVNLASSKRTEQQKLAQLARGQEQLSKEEVFVKATGRAIEKALSVGRWFEEREAEYAVRVKTGSVLVVDDIVEDEEAKQKVIEEAERAREQQEQALPESRDGEKPVASAEYTAQHASTPASAEKETQQQQQQKKRKRAANAPTEDEELPETRTRWVNMVEVAISLK
ncbi:ribonuclease P subunit p20 family protein [Aspergillus clavatus NRRL 1]|uniref:Uncharacterized protein n=1 Tax=Aspergillus clavatus (strain ATCC 1007 / CBS 513.65 / DSM 816 / NCTC 3887 / NRRL 1 / QM 1276 / 107) TaxID=344612 RepID=A1CF93_ASPCL|nr:uncharacterized protein ACLA_092400 [Aspergillus clavatus NRRL 1]EAW11542.1 conserved hypothetical protein [Aspergillus clavatus NRRL 1]